MPYLSSSEFWEINMETYMKIIFKVPLRNNLHGVRITFLVYSFISFDRSYTYAYTTIITVQENSTTSPILTVPFVFSISKHLPESLQFSLFQSVVYVESFWVWLPSFFHNILWDSSMLLCWWVFCPFWSVFEEMFLTVLKSSESILKKKCK